jgi:hypothetical protein
LAITGSRNIDRENLEMVKHILIGIISKRKFIMKGLILASAFSLAIFSQDSYEQEDRAEYPRFRVRLETGELIEGREGCFTLTAFNGFLGNGKEMSVNKDDIMKIEIPSGSMAGRDALYGVGIGVIVSSLIWASANGGDSSPYQDAMFKGGLVIPVTLYVTGVFAGVGYIIGSFQPKWEEVPIRNSFMFDVQEKGVTFAFSMPF